MVDSGKAGAPQPRAGPDPGDEPAGRPPLLRQFAKFAAVGLLNTCVELVVYNGLLVVHPARHDVALLTLYSTLGVSGAILNSYLLNTRWAFRSEPGAQRDISKWRRRLLFGIQAGVNIAINDAITVGLSAALAGATFVPTVVSQNLAKFVAMGASSMASYAMLRLVVFND